jgi:hypothetical protein
VGVAKAGPMQRRRIFLVSDVNVAETLFEIGLKKDQRERGVALSCHMDYAQLLIVPESRIRT